MSKKLGIGYKTLRVHFLCWFLFILYESLVSYSYSKRLPQIADYLGHYTLNISLFYFNAYIFKRFTQANARRLVLLILFIAAEIGIYILIKYMMYLMFISFNIYKPSQIDALFVTESVYRAIYFIGLSTGYWFAVSSFNQQKEIGILKEDKLKTLLEKELAEKRMLASENANLKTQINPHLIFNILGTIHNTLLKHSSEASQMIILLSDIMRYAIEKPNFGYKVELTEEIEQIRNYIAINQYRYAQQLPVLFQINGISQHVTIIPLLFVTIVENIFKYGDLTDPRFPAQIFISIEDDILNLNVSNKKKKLNIPHGFGIGMSNTKKRLEYNYPNNYILNIKETDTTYTLNLSIKVND